MCFDSANDGRSESSMCDGDTGQWIDGLDQGYGQCVSAGGVTYDGQWEHGNRQVHILHCMMPGLCHLQGKLHDVPNHKSGKCRKSCRVCRLE